MGKPNQLIPGHLKMTVRVLKCGSCHPPHGFRIMPEKNFLQRENGRPPSIARENAALGAAIRPFLAGEIRLLEAIRHVILKEMLARV